MTASVERAFPATIGVVRDTSHKTEAGKQKISTIITMYTDDVPVEDLLDLVNRKVVVIVSDKE